MSSSDLLCLILKQSILEKSCHTEFDPSQPAWLAKVKGIKFSPLEDRNCDLFLSRPWAAQHSQHFVLYPKMCYAMQIKRVPL